MGQLLFLEENRVYTFSMHGKKNYPFKKEISDLDVELDDGIKEMNTLKRLNTPLKN